jgi:hypothetical protein
MLPYVCKSNKPYAEYFIRLQTVKKTDHMPELKLIQLQYESDTWKRLLGFMMDENIHQKNRISAILKNGFDRNLLEEMEGFHTRFIKEDELIALLRNEVAELEKLLVREIFEDGKVIKEVDRKLKIFRNHVITAENQFSKLKLEFNNYLTENI